MKGIMILLGLVTILFIGTVLHSQYVLEKQIQQDCREVQELIEQQRDLHYLYKPRRKPLPIYLVPKRSKYEQFI